LRIGGIVLLPLDERLHISRRNQPYLVAEPLQLTPPVMGAGTGLQRHDAPWLLCEECQQPHAADPFAERHAPALIDTVRVKNMLGDIQPDRGNLLHGRLPQVK
jgi:hypothetical protein